MKNKLEKLKKDFENSLKKIEDLNSLEELYNKYFSRKAGEMTEVMKSLKELTGDARKEMGALANTIKATMEELFEKSKKTLENNKWETLLETEKIDITQAKLPKTRQGSKHPVTLVHETLEDLFTSMGFMLLDGPELESDYYNFEALNIPQDHPARDTQDTFFIKDNKDTVMRTQTSSVQVRAMQKYGAPLRAVVPGRVFRNEAIDASHDHTFYQMEGIVIDKDISISHLLGVVKELLSGVFGREVEVRLRPGHFDFVEPGFELDMKCLVCEGKGCGACKHSGWVETLPCGLVHPSVI
ncbi:MAG: phenylalanine--tRNA ligase subunit alpha, partial [Patescibacteria group bacterium]|nr:phenylalanine--tRNA ligase subunit alpha [Patescibacteria group bacterium]